MEKEKTKNASCHIVQTYQSVIKINIVYNVVFSNPSCLFAGLGQRKVSDNRGGGGGGVGGNFRADQTGEPGAGGGYGTVG